MSASHQPALSFAKELSFPGITSTAGTENYFYVESFSVLDMDADHYTDRKGAPTYLILYTYEGKGELSYEGKLYTVKPGDGFFIDCNVPHSYRTTAKAWKYSALHLNGSAMPIYYGDYACEHSPIFAGETGISYQQKLQEIISSYSKTMAYRELRISSLIESLLTELIVSGNNGQKDASALDAGMEVLIRYLQDHFQEDISLDKMAQISHISKYYMSREFHKYTGFPPYEYLIQLRIQQAKLLLLNSDYPIYKIAEMVGMPNEKNFITAFKNHLGLTPSQFRKQL